MKRGFLALRQFRNRLDLKRDLIVPVREAADDHLLFHAVTYRVVVEAVHADLCLVTKALDLVACLMIRHTAERWHHWRDAWRCEFRRFEKLGALSFQQRLPHIRRVGHAGDPVAVKLPHAVLAQKFQLQHIVTHQLAILTQVDLAEINQVRSVSHRLRLQQTQPVKWRRLHT